MLSKHLKLSVLGVKVFSLIIALKGFLCSMYFGTGLCLDVKVYIMKLRQQPANLSPSCREGI